MRASIEGALSFRNEQSGILYDLLSSADDGGWGQQFFTSIEGGCFPWTSRDENLASLTLILQAFACLSRDRDQETGLTFPKFALTA